MAKRPTTAEERAPEKQRDEIIREAARLEEDVLFSSKEHLITAAWWRTLHLWLGIPTVIMSAIVGATAISKYQTTHEWVAIVVGVMSITVAILSGLSTFFNPNERQAAYHNAGTSFDKLWNDLRQFRTIHCWEATPLTELVAKLDLLTQRKADLNQKCPQPPKWAYKKAKKAIEDGEATHAVDKEQLASAASTDPSPPPTAAPQG